MPVRIARDPKPHITRREPTATLRLPGMKGDPGVADDASVAALVDNAASDTAASLNASYGRGAQERAAKAQGRRLRAITAGNQSVPGEPVTVAAMVHIATASTIPTPVRQNAWDKTNSRVHTAMRVLGTNPVQAGGTAPLNDAVKPDPAVVTYAPGPLAGTGIRVDTTCSDDSVDVLLYNNGASTQHIYVDGILVTTITDADMTGAGFGPGNRVRVNLGFQDARNRLITWESIKTTGVSFPGFDTATATSLAYPSASAKGPRVLFVGDSFTEGTGVTAGDPFYKWVSLHMGWPDAWRCGSGSTGYYEDGTRLALVDRYQADVIDHAPDVVVLACGLNDKAAWEAGSTAAVLSAAETVWDAITTQRPQTEVVVVGPWLDGGFASGVNPDPDPSLVAMDAAFADSAASRGLRYISPVSERWQYTLYDATHPDDAGHELLGWRLAGHLASPFVAAP